MATGFEFCAEYHVYRLKILAMSATDRRLFAFSSPVSFVSVTRELDGRPLRDTGFGGSTGGTEGKLLQLTSTTTNIRFQLLLLISKTETTRSSET